MTHKTHILLSAGGTGGHVMPALALAAMLREKGAEVSLATDQRGAGLLNDDRTRDLKEVIVLPAGAPGGGVLKKIKGLACLAHGYLKAGTHIRRITPDAIVAFGGYPCVPAALAGAHKGIPLILHEQNAILGRANAFLARDAKALALSWPRTSGLPEGLPTEHTGNPVRPEIVAIGAQPYAPPEKDGVLRILICGGSLGAQVFSDVLPDAFAALDNKARARLQIVQQCREEHLEQVRRRYHALGINAWLAPFIDDMAAEIATAHLFIGRSGASTVAEIAAAGRPAIYVPYPWHKDQQQKYNADVIAAQGGAWTLTQDSFTPEGVSACLSDFLDAPGKLADAANAARDCGRPDAALRLAESVFRVMGH